jgi:hypothetical protein
MLLLNPRINLLLVGILWIFGNRKLEGLGKILRAGVEHLI